MSVRCVCVYWGLLMWNVWSSSSVWRVFERTTMICQRILKIWKIFRSIFVKIEFLTPLLCKQTNFLCGKLIVRYEICITINSRQSGKKTNKFTGKLNFELSEIKNSSIINLSQINQSNQSSFHTFHHIKFWKLDSINSKHKHSSSFREHIFR